MKKKAAVALLSLSLMLAGCSLFEDPVEKGVGQLQEKSYEEAVASFRKAIEKDKNVGEAYRGIGLAYWEQEQYDQAFEAFDQALANEAKQTPEMYNMMAICRMKAEDYSGAISYFELGIAAVAQGEDAEMLQEMKFNVVSCYEKLLDWESAKAKMAEYIAAYPDDEQAVKEAAFLETR